MYGEDKKLLFPEHINSKHSNEGFGDISESEEDMAKKPKHEEEDERVLKKRKRNKEAAERSRKKKKEEFEKLQSENDQLNQDKCELVAMVEKLKGDVSTVEKENLKLNADFSELKRWVAKRVIELGLDKYLSRNGSPGKIKTSLPEPSESPLMHDNDPSLHNASGRMVAEEQGTDSKDAPSSPKSLSSHASVESLQSAEIHTSTCQIQTPWLVDQSALAKYQTADSKKEIISTVPPSAGHVQQLSEVQSVLMAQGQQVLCLPKDMIYIVQSEDKQPMITEAPEMRPVVAASPVKEQVATKPCEMQTTKVSDNINGVAGLYGDITIPHSTSFIDPSTATAIESLLKLGYKVQMPGPE